MYKQKAKYSYIISRRLMENWYSTHAESIEIIRYIEKKRNVLAEQHEKLAEIKPYS
jgi:hypothetical protein